MADTTIRPAATAGQDVDSGGASLSSAAPESPAVVASLVDSLDMGFMICDRELRVQTVNLRMARLAGLEASATVGRDAGAALAPLVGREVEDLLQKALSGERSISGDLSCTGAASGDGGWVVGHFLPRRDGEGEVLGVVALFEDVTRRRRAELARQATERDLILHDRIAEVFLTEPEAEMYSTVLAILLEELDSPHGIFGYIAPDGSLVVPSWTQEVFDACRVANPTAVFPRESWAGMWGAALLDRTPAMSNSPGRVPDGHIPIRRSMFAPIVHAERVVGLLVVANRDRDYTPDDLERLGHIASHVAPILEARVSRDVAAENRGRAEAELRRSEARYRAIVEHQSELVTRFGADGVLTFVNQAVCRSMGLSCEEILGRSLYSILPPGAAEPSRRHLETLSPSQPVGESEIEWHGRDGGVRWIRWISHGFFDDAGRLREVQAVGRDVTESRRREQELRWALGEQELLLKEVHHRVKNNLAVISSLLRLQADRLGDPRVGAAFATIQDRIRAMAVVHEQLYRSGELRNVNLVAYLEELVRMLARSYQEGSGGITLNPRFEPARAEIGEAIPCGLIVTELVSNAYRHAFRGRSEGRIDVRFGRRPGGRHELVVRDDGIGIAPSAREAGGGRGFGLDMVRLLAAQLDGTVEIEAGDGTEIRVAVSLSEG